MPLLGRLGCNGRACHGSFQGRGGFRLSLFGYDFKSDHDALLDGRVDVEDPQFSLIIEKPISDEDHEGGKRYEEHSWQHHVLRRWIEAGAEFDTQTIHQLVELEIAPSELVFSKPGEKVQLTATAVWQDGTREDVTPLCRFQTNDDQVAKVDEDGLVTSAQSGDTHLVVFYDNAVVPVPAMQPVSELVGESYPDVPTPTELDRFVVSKLRKLGIVPADLSSDAAFLRRVSLDLTGTLPSETEVKQFLADDSKNKREQKIEELLNTPAYAAWWTTKICDFTGNNDFQLRNTIPEERNGVLASNTWYQWIYKRIADNEPYDSLVAGIVLATSEPSESGYADYCKTMCETYAEQSGKTPADLPFMPWYWARRDLRDAEPRAINFAHAFLGIRIQCAQCHKHPFDQWSKDDFAEFTNFFRQVVLVSNNALRRDYADDYDKLIASLELSPELNGSQMRRELGRLMQSEKKTIPFPILEVGRPRQSRDPDAAVTEMTHAKVLGGEAYEIQDGQDVRSHLMDWLRSPENPYFARAFVNRVWATYFGRGIVEPPDDNSLANPPSNKPLLDYLTKGFIESGFDMKWVHRTIARSRTYQLSWVPNETNERDEMNFSHALPRRLPAEVLFDSIQQVTADDSRAELMQTNLTGRAISIPGASVRFSNRSPSGYAMQLFGRSVRETNCDCDRSADPSLLQTVYLQNDEDVHDMIDQPDGWLSQLAARHGLDRPADSRLADPPEGFERLVVSLRKNISQLKRDGRQERSREMRQHLVTLLRTYGNPFTKKIREKEQAKPLDAGAVVQQVYLRTLGRFPDQRELARCVDHIEQSEDTLNGVRGVLWALLNTKEFIVNH